MSVKKFTFSDADGEHSVDERGWCELKTPDGTEYSMLLPLIWRGYLAYIKEHEDEFMELDP